MRRDFVSWLTRPSTRRRQRPRSRSRLSGCLLWLVLIVIVLIVISLLFGGFRKGSKVGGAGAPRPVPAALALR
jgi:cobalamin biosynthesis protein CobD/CbiB